MRRRCCAVTHPTPPPPSQRACISLLYEAALLCDDDTRLQRAVPFLVTQIGDASAVVRRARRALTGDAHNGGAPRLPACTPLLAVLRPPAGLTPPCNSACLRQQHRRTLALRCLVRLVASVRSLPPGDAKVWRAGALARSRAGVYCRQNSPAAPTPRCQCTDSTANLASLNSKPRPGAPRLPAALAAPAAPRNTRHWWQHPPRCTTTTCCPPSQPQTSHTLHIA